MARRRVSAGGALLPARAATRTDRARTDATSVKVTRSSNNSGGGAGRNVAAGNDTWLGVGSPRGECLRRWPDGREIDPGREQRRRRLVLDAVVGELADYGRGSRSPARVLTSSYFPPVLPRLRPISRFKFAYRVPRANCVVDANAARRIGILRVYATVRT